MKNPGEDDYSLGHLWQVVVRVCVQQDSGYGSMLEAVQFKERCSLRKKSYVKLYRSSERINN